MSDQVRFTETMCGWLDAAVAQSHEGAAGSGKAVGTAASFTLTVITPDVDKMVLDPDHRSPAFGLVQCAAIHPLPIAVHDGHLDLFVDAAPGVLHMHYRLALRDVDGHRYTLRGIKEIVRRSWFPTSLPDTTTLFVDVFDGETTEGRPRLRGVFWMGPGGVLAQGLSFRGTLRGIANFLTYYVRRCAHIYLGPRREPIRPEWSRIPPL